MSENPVCCLPEETVGQAARVMRREHIGSIPVISDDRSRSLIGIISDRDLAIKLVAESRDPNQTQVFDIMTRAIVACRNTDDASSAAKAMREHQLRQIPVVDYEGRIVGMISQEDVILRSQPRETSNAIANLPQAA